MASRFYDLINTKGTHAVGNLNSWNMNQINQGAKVADKAIDNFTIVELGFNKEGERICKQLTDVSKEQFLIASTERRIETPFFTEKLCDFYNAQDEQAQIWLIPAGVRFESSAYSLNDGVKEIKNGMVAHFDPSTKKFIISDSSKPNENYAKSSKKFLVVDYENCPSIDGYKTVRFEVQ